MPNDILPPKRILVADDDEITRALMKIMLSRAGFEVSFAIDGKQALELLAEAPPDLLITDVMMPNLDGFELLERVRASSATRSLPVILLTAKTTMDDVLQGYGLGADDYLTKPFQIGDLLKRVKAKLSPNPAPAE